MSKFHYGCINLVQRKFVREENPPSNKFHRNFRLWLDRNPALDEAAVLEEDKTINYSQKDIVEEEFESNRSDERPGDTGGLDGGHYIDPDNSSLHDGSYDHEEYSPSSLPGDGSNIHVSLTEYQDWGAQHGETVASLLENC